MSTAPDLRDAVEMDLPEIVGIYNSNVSTRVSTADTEPVSAQSRLAWFREHNPSRRPLWVAEEAGEIAGWLSLGDFYDGRPAYHATAEVGVYVREGRRGKGIGRRLLSEAVARAGARDLDADRRHRQTQRGEPRAVRPLRIREVGDLPTGRRTRWRRT